ncbi:MAG: heavy metal translocating P-type ATPase [Eubacterium sp.]|nr:heavy metal translocating P-type ATPase [Eubacterium sp.]
MKFRILHESARRMRVHMCQPKMSYEQADILEYYLQQKKGIDCVKVHERTANVIFEYSIPKEEVESYLNDFHYREVEVPAGLIENSSRELNAKYQEKLVMRIFWRYTRRWFIPMPIRIVWTTFKAIRYIIKGLKCLAKGKIEVSVLDATAIAVSLLRRDFRTAGSVMFLLGIGELLEEWTQKKSIDDLARTMSLNISKVWLVSDGQQVLVPANEIKVGDQIVVHMGNVIPFDGEVAQGDGMVNQASMTGEGVPVQKEDGDYVYAGTVLEEGELTINVKEVGCSSRYEKIVRMIEDSEKLKAGAESKAEHLADKLVPYTLGGTALTYILTRNATKALSILMVDFSCALKLAMPISVLSAIREASQHKITVKGGKYLEAVAEADTIIFDKTGTLTKATPTVAKVVSFCSKSEDEMLRVAACMEEHFPHSMAKAVIDAAAQKGLDHEEMHTKVDYVVAHGISTTIDGKKAIIGSYHFVFEDEECTIPRGKKTLFKELPEEYSHLYLAVENKLAAVICIEDPVREEAADVIEQLRKKGISKIVMMTGDSEKTAASIAKKIGVDEYYSEVLPEDKAAFVEKEKAQGRKVIMVGDGINDSPALSASDCGIAISDGAEIAREIADITIGAEDLYELLTLKDLSDALMKRIHNNYRAIMGFNGGLIGLGVLGIMPPTASALLHNASTLLIGMNSMKNLLD